MEMPLNEFKRALRADTANAENDGNNTQIGVFLGTCDPTIAEIIATTGFDWLLIDGEHAPNTPALVLRQLQAMAPYPVRPVVRIVNHDPALIKQYLDVGVQTLLVPMVESAGEARNLVRAMRYPSAGVRGVGTALARAARWNGVASYLAHADEQMCLLVQIESRAGLAAIDEIAAVEGVDGIFIGPSDLAASLGHLGHPEHPDVQSAIGHALARIHAAGKAAGIFSTDPAAAMTYRQRGARFLLVGVDTLLLRHAAVQLAGTFRGA